MQLQNLKQYIQIKFIVIVLLFHPFVGASQNFDINLLKKINPNTPVPTSNYWKQTSNSAYWLPATLCLGQLSYGFIQNDVNAKRGGVEMAISVGIGQIFANSLKYTINRPRPYQSWPNDIHPINYGLGLSFPSGHTTVAFSTSTAFTFTHPQLSVAIPINVWAGSVGYSRMYLGRHYPTDVLGGMVIGIVSGILGHWVTRSIYKE
jgi:membrane-associated phospholipid phosphatase